MQRQLEERMLDEELSADKGSEDPQKGQKERHAAPLRDIMITRPGSPGIDPLV